jgi:PP-loop superfamily ATP-utilizing enzyme
VIGYSAGKDSTLLLQLVFDAPSVDTQNRP